MLEELLKKAGWDSPDRVACVVGPGGFTSLRVAVSLVNAIAWAKKIPSAGIHLSDLCRARCPNRDALWIHSTKKEEVFVRGFGSFLETWPQPQHMALGDFLSYLPDSVAWVGELIPEHRTEIDKRGGKPALVRDLSATLPSFLNQQSYVEEQLEPWYGRGW